jgi:hypothetical protein
LFNLKLDETFQSKYDIFIFKLEDSQKSESDCGDSQPGLTNSAHFAKIRWIRAGPNSKITEFTVHCFKISEKDKN